MRPPPTGPASGASRRRALIAALGLASVFIGHAARAAQPAVNTLKNSRLFSGRTGIAIGGYDTVAYFTAGQAVEGLDRLAFEWSGAKWKFASAANLELFKADPRRYGPQYGGYCAYGVAQGYLVKVDPERFTVRDGRLYLNYDADVQATWLKNVAGYIGSADQKFPGLLLK